MNYLYPWSMHFNVSNDELAQWEAENKTHLPLAVWAMENGKFTEEDFQNWAQTFYALPLMKTEFFHQPAEPDLWKKTKEWFVWTEVLLPLYEWDGTLFVGCIEPARNLDLNCEVQFVLCRFEDLCIRWHQYQNNGKQAQLRQVAFDEALENAPTLAGIDLKALEAEENISESNKIEPKSVQKEPVVENASDTKSPSPPPPPNPDSTSELPDLEAQKTPAPETSQAKANAPDIEVPPPAPVEPPPVQAEAPPASAEAPPAPISATANDEVERPIKPEKTAEPKADDTPKMQTLGKVSLSFNKSAKDDKKKSANALLSDLISKSDDEFDVTVVKANQTDKKSTEPKSEVSPPPPAAPASASDSESVSAQPSSQPSPPVTETPAEEAAPPQAPEGIEGVASESAAPAGGLEGLNLDALANIKSENKDSFDFNQLAKEQGIETPCEEKPIEASADIPAGMEGLNLEVKDNEPKLEGIKAPDQIASFDFANLESSAPSDQATPAPAMEPQQPAPATNQASAQENVAPPPPPPAQQNGVAAPELSFETIAPIDPDADQPSQPVPNEASASLASEKIFQEDAAPPEIEKSVVRSDSNTNVALESVKNIDDLASFIFNKMDKHFERKLLYVNYRGQGFEPIRWTEQWFVTKNAKRSVIDITSPNMFHIAYKTKKPFHGKVSENPINDQFFVRWNKGQYLPAITIYPVLNGEEIIAFFVGTPRSIDYTFDALHQLDHFAPQVAPALSVLNSLAS